MKHLLFIGVVLLAAAPSTDAQTSEGQARSYVLSAFLTGAAQAILASNVELTERLEARLKLPPNAGRDKAYAALTEITNDKAIRVRNATAAEAGVIGARAGARPVFVVQGGATDFVVAYDLREDNITLVGLVGEAPPPPAPAPPPAPLFVADRTSGGPTTVAAIPTLITMKPIHFEYRSATLSPVARARLEAEPAPKFAMSKGMRVVVQGYSDRIGSSRYNQRLSQLRAEAVRDYLVAKGIPAENIQAVGLGSKLPATACKQKKKRPLAACLAPDRQVIVEIRSAT